jgi:hypothetical protein
MPTDPQQLRANGNFFGNIRARFANDFMHVDHRGRGDLPVYVLPYAPLLGGFPQDVAAKWKAMIGNPDTHTQPTFHRDDGNYLPEAPPAEGYPELHIAGNGLPHPAMLRLVVDCGRQRLFMTPTHYEPWNDGSRDRNPFFLIQGAPIPRFGDIWRGIITTV